MAQVLEVDPATLDPQAEADSVDGWDSLTHLAIITAVEAEFHIELSMDVIAEIDSVEALHLAIRDADAA